MRMRILDEWVSINVKLYFVVIIKTCLMIVFSQQFSCDFWVVSFSIAFVSIQELNDVGYPIYFTRDLSPSL